MGCPSSASRTSPAKPSRASAIERLLDLDVAIVMAILSDGTDHRKTRCSGGLVRRAVTLAHYLDLLAGAGLLMGLPTFAGQAVRQRGLSPKLRVLNTGTTRTIRPLASGISARRPASEAFSASP